MASRWTTIETTVCIYAEALPRAGDATHLLCESRCVMFTERFCDIYQDPLLHAVELDRGARPL